MKITKFDRNNCGEVRAILEKALQDAGIEGVTISTKGGRFSPDKFGFSVSIETTKTSADGFAIGSELKRGMLLHNISKTQGPRFQLIDFHQRKYKCPFIVEDAKGKRFKLTVLQAKGEFA